MPLLALRRRCSYSTYENSGSLYSHRWIRRRGNPPTQRIPGRRDEILRAKLGAQVPLTDAERIRLARIGNKLGKKALKGLSAIVKPETIIAWYRKLIAKKFDSSQKPKGPGRPPIDRTLEELVVRLAEENPSWGYDRIAGALSNLGHKISDTTVGKILERNGIQPAPKRKPEVSWSDFIKMHEDVLSACDFLTVEVLTPAGLVTYYVLFVIQLGSRRVHIAGITTNPNAAWMRQIAPTWDGILKERDSRHPAICTLRVLISMTNKTE